MGKKIVLRKKDAGTWHDLYPRTTDDQVFFDSGKNLYDMAKQGGGFIMQATGDNNYTATCADVLAYSENLTVEVLFTASNSGAPTLNINNFGVVALGQLDQSGVFTGLKTGFLPAYQYVRFRMMGGNLILLSTPGGGGSGDGIYMGVTPPEDTDLTWFYDLGTGTLENTLVLLNGSMIDPNADVTMEEISPQE